MTQHLKTALQAVKGMGHAPTPSQASLTNCFCLSCDPVSGEIGLECVKSSPTKIDHETEIRLELHQEQANKRDNEEIMSAYHRAFIDGFDNWFNAGMQGRAMDEIVRLMGQRGGMP